jgi:hypothetical protein
MDANEEPFGRESLAVEVIIDAANRAIAASMEMMERVGRYGPPRPPLCGAPPPRQRTAARGKPVSGLGC